MKRSALLTVAILMALPFFLAPNTSEEDPPFDTFLYASLTGIGTDTDTNTIPIALCGGASSPCGFSLNIYVTAGDVPGIYIVKLRRNGLLIFSDEYETDTSGPYSTNFQGFEGDTFTLEVKSFGSGSGGNASITAESTF